MPTHPSQRPTAAARLLAAIQSVDWPHHLSPSPARQTTPNPANARQTTPSNAPAQNEATTTRRCTPNAPECPEMSRPTHDHDVVTAPPIARQTPPNHANARHDDARRKTNPPAQPPLARTRPPRPLTPNQLRAVHLLLAGHSTTQISATLHIDRHTLATWKRLPLFQAELRHLLHAPPSVMAEAQTQSS